MAVNRFLQPAKRSKGLQGLVNQMKVKSRYRELRNQQKTRDGITVWRNRHDLDLSSDARFLTAATDIGTGALYRGDKLSNPAIGIEDEHQ